MSLLDDFEKNLQQGLLPAGIFNDHDLHKLELRRIFGRSWLFVGHETEIPRRGDYALRYLGSDPFIFIRGSDDVVRVLFNACRHRGTPICRSEMGNTKQFTCPYHGWTYDNTGTLVAVPARRDGYRELEFGKWGLFSAPRIATYHGMIFASLDPSAVSLEQYLGRFRWYLDIHLMLTEGGMEVLGEPHRWVVESNWKQGSENFAGDNSHTAITHRSALETGALTTDTADALRTGRGIQINDCDGHVVSIRQSATGQKVFWQYPSEVVSLFKPELLSPAQFELASRGLVHTGTIFPNLSFLHTGVASSKEHLPSGYFSLHVWQPKGPNKTEIWNWLLAPKEASQEYKERAYQLGMSSFGTSGSFEQDDVTIWPGIARSAGSNFAQISNLKLNYQMGLGAMTTVTPATDWPGPGTAIPSNSSEGGLRAFYQTWYNHIASTVA